MKTKMKEKKREVEIIMHEFREIGLSGSVSNSVTMCSCFLLQSNHIPSDTTFTLNVCANVYQAVIA